VVVVRSFGREETIEAGSIGMVSVRYVGEINKVISEEEEGYIAFSSCEFREEACC
jgi:hypothetical protein